MTIPHTVTNYMALMFHVLGMGVLRYKHLCGKQLYAVLLCVLSEFCSLCYNTLLGKAAMHNIVHNIICTKIIHSKAAAFCKANWPSTFQKKNAEFSTSSSELYIDLHLHLKEVSSFNILQQLDLIFFICRFHSRFQIYRSRCRDVDVDLHIVGLS